MTTCAVVLSAATIMAGSVLFARPALSAVTSGTAAPSIVQGRAYQSMPADSYPPGLPAIQPITAPSVSDTGQSAATFGQAEVAQFLAKYPSFMRGTPDSSGGQLAKVEFISAAEASTRLKGEWIGRSDTTLVCWAEVTGPLDLSGLSLPAFVVRQHPQPLTAAAKGILVFDAQTGNLLLRSYTNTP